jgi:hypothetical protein
MTADSVQATKTHHDPWARRTSPGAGCYQQDRKRTKIWSAARDGRLKFWLRLLLGQPLDPAPGSVKNIFIRLILARAQRLIDKRGLIVHS